MNNQKEGNIFATREQELLLKAALFQGESAIEAWQKWRTRVDFEQELDGGSYRLLPLVYHNLYKLGVNDPLMSKLKGIHRREWYKNQMLFHTIAEVLRLFQSAGIETMILKGAALTLLYYKGYGLRPMSDFDVLVPAVKRRMAMDVLAQAGWNPLLRPMENLTDAVLNVRHGWNFENTNQRQFDLHWHALHWGLHPNSDDDFWADATPVKVADVSTSALNPADQLLHVCVHGIVWHPTPSLRWIADAMMILNETKSEIEWSRLIYQAEKRRLTLPLHQTLAYLRDSFDAAIPSRVLTEMSKIRVSDLEYNLYNAAASQKGLLGGLPYNWYQYSFDLEARGEMNWIQKLVGFPRYVKLYMAQDHREFLKWMISRTIVRIGKAVFGRI